MEDLMIDMKCLDSAISLIEKNIPMDDNVERDLYRLRVIREKIKIQIFDESRTALLKSTPARCQSPFIKPCNYPAGTCQECSQEML